MSEKSDGLIMNFDRKFRRMQKKRDVEGLIKMLDELEPDERRKVIFSLGTLRDPRAVEPLIALIHDKAVGGATCGALGTIGDHRAIAPLRKVLDDPSLSTFHKREAQHSLEQLEGTTVGAMTFISGDALEKMLSGTMTTSLSCRNCGFTFTFEDGASSARHQGIQAKIVMCAKCHSVFEADVTPRGVALLADVTRSYPQARKQGE